MSDVTTPGSSSSPEAARAVRDRLRASNRLLNAVGQAVVAWDLDGTVTFLNDAAASMYGWPKDVAIGTQAMELSRVRLSPTQIADIAETLDAGRSWSGELTIGRADGSVAPVWATNTPIIEDEAVVGYIGVSIEIGARKDAEALVWHRATHDPLTDLANHQSLTDQICDRMAWLDRGVSLTVVLVDIGSLEVVYDTLGYSEGQEVIQRSARHLGELIHEGDLLARFSDLTFAVCCSHDITDVSAVSYAERLRRELAAAGSAARSDIHLKVAAAVASVTPPTEGAADILRCVATALTRARRHGTTEVYDESMRAELARRQQMESLVDRTIESGVVGLGYQPIVRLHDEITVGAEALLRLIDDSGAPASAIEVVQAAERMGRIGELGGLVLAQACRDAAVWQAAVPDRPIAISVNVSASQLDDASLPARVTAAVSDAGLDASALWLEITESALMNDPRRCGMVLADLRARGVRLSADDFGTGYSSLAYLRRFPLDTLKVDQAFVSGLPESVEDHAIIQAVLAMADALGLSVVAEGVERSSQLAELRALGTAYGQGFLWSPAISATALLERVVGESDHAAVTVGPRPHRQRSRPEASLGITGGVSPAERTDATIAILAHEIRQPLTVVRGYAGLLKRSEDAEAAEMAGIMARAISRIERILANVVEASAVDATALELDLVEVDIVDVVRVAVIELQTSVVNPLALGAVPDETEILSIDVGQIRQVLDNLINNASKFSPPGSPIEVTVAVDDDFVDIGVSDEGEGIEPGDLGLVFRKYGQATGNLGGTGIGLFLARHIARHHGGDIVYRRRVDTAGSMLLLRLPRRDPAWSPADDLPEPLIDG